MTLDSSPQSPPRVVVLDVHGDLDIATQGSLELAILRLLKDSSVVADCAGVEFLAISALRSLMLCQNHAAVRGRGLVYAAMPAMARRVINLAGLEKRLVLADSVAEAQAYLTAQP